MFKKLITCFIIPAVLSAGSVYAFNFKCVNDDTNLQQQMESAYKASCRVFSGTAYGSGTFFLHQNEKCYILTNQHVVGNATKVRCDFWTNKVKESVNGKVVWRSYNTTSPNDFAVIEIPENDLAKINPPYIPIAPQEWINTCDSFILSAGCPKGRNVVAWVGKITNDQGITVRFQPAPVPGQSGSSIISRKDGKMGITHVLTWLIGQEGNDDSEGGAIPIGNLVAALRGSNANHEVGEKINNIPEGAIECAGNVKVKIFSQPNCSPCKAIEKFVEPLKNIGIDISVVDLTTYAGAVDARNYKVTQTPTTIVVDEENNVLDKIVGYTDLTLALEGYIPAPDIAEDPEDNDSNEEEGLSINREPISEKADASLTEGISEQWFRFNNNNNNNNDNNGNIVPPRIVEPKIDEEKLGEKLSNSLNGRISKEFQGFAEVLGSYLDKSVDGIKDNVDKNFDKATKDISSAMEKTLTEKIKEKASVLITDIKNILICIFIVIIVSIVCTCAAIKSYVNYIYNKVISYVDAMFEENKQTTNDSFETIKEDISNIKNDIDSLKTDIKTEIKNSATGIKSEFKKELNKNDSSEKTTKEPVKEESKTTKTTKKKG